MWLVERKMAYHVIWQAASSSNGNKFQVKHKMKGGCVQAEDLFKIIIFFKNIVKSSLENL